MLLATFRADATAIRLLSQQFNQMCDLWPELNHSHKLTFIPGNPECAVSGDSNSVMRFIGTVASFGSNCLVKVGPQQSKNLLSEAAPDDKEIHMNGFEFSHYETCYDNHGCAWVKAWYVGPDGTRKWLPAD